MTTETKVTHTPGPWFVSGSPSGSHIQIFGKDEKGGGCVAQVYRLGMSTHERFQELAANAHLIAAAPDMLEALIALREMIRGTEAATNCPCNLVSEHETRCPISQAEAAIAKAKGGAA